MNQQQTPHRRRRIGLTVAAAVIAAFGLVLIIGAVVTDRPGPQAAPDVGGTDIGGTDRPGSSAARTPSAVPSASTGGTLTPSPSPSRAEKSGTPTAEPAEKGASGPAPLPESRPQHIAIPAIDVSASFVELGLGSQGQLETPSDPADVGWFVGSRSPGGPGPSVVAGHVTWNGARSVFFGLGELERGDRVKVRRDDGTTAVFAVTSRGTFGKDEFPTDQVYTNSERPELVMITCGGDYDADQHYYDSNVIVRAKLVGQRS